MKIEDINWTKNTLIITSDDYKKKFLEYFYTHKIIANVNFMTLGEYKKNYFFDYDYRAIKHLQDNHHLSVGNAKEILDNLIYINEQVYNNDKLDCLVAYKKELRSLGLLIENPLFRKYLSTKDVFVIGYGQLNDFDKNIIEGNNVEIVADDVVAKKYRIGKFDNIEQEVAYLYQQIFGLLQKGININHIYVVNATKDYQAYFKRYNSYYDFKVETGNNDKLACCQKARCFMEKVDSGVNREEIYTALAQHNDAINQQLINIINKYPGSLLEVRDLIIDDLNNTVLHHDKYDNIVRCCDNGTFFDCDDYVFVVGFNDSYPVFKKDNQFINDDDCKILHLPVVDEINRITKENTKAWLSNIDNLCLSYSCKTPFNAYNNSYLLNEEEYEEYCGEIATSYNEKANRVAYDYMQDKLTKFGYYDDDYQTMYHAYGDNNYNSYNNKFTGLINNKEQLDEVELSYSSIDKYYKCAFRYYLESILKIKDEGDDYNARLGNILHAMLQQALPNRNFDLEQAWDNYIRDFENNNDEPLIKNFMEEFFFDKLKVECQQTIDMVRQQQDNSRLETQLYEKYLRVNVDEKTIFKGFIDKLMYARSGDDFIAFIVDYKSSKKVKIDQSLMEYGLSLQLPSYLYLLNKSNLLNGKVKYGGLFIQYIVKNSNKAEDDKEDEDLKRESLKLDGVYSTDAQRLYYLEPDLSVSSSSQVIKGLRTTASGKPYSNNNAIDDSQFEQMYHNMDQKIKEASSNIRQANFKINPKQIGGENHSCQYCPFADICYKRNDDLIIIEKSAKQE